jgi:hypothetical protein
MRTTVITKSPRTGGGPDSWAPAEYVWVTICDDCKACDQDGTPFDDDDVCVTCAKRREADLMAEEAESE